MVHHPSQERPWLTSVSLAAGYIVASTPLSQERLIAAMQSNGLDESEYLPPRPVFIVSLGDEALSENMMLAQMLRQRGIACEMELANRKVKAQMKRADKSGAKYVIIRGDTELEKGTLVLKDMEAGTQRDVELPELMELLV